MGKYFPVIFLVYDGEEVIKLADNIYAIPWYML